MIERFQGELPGLELGVDLAFWVSYSLETVYERAKMFCGFGLNSSIPKEQHLISNRAMNFINVGCLRRDSDQRHEADASHHLQVGKGIVIHFLEAGHPTALANVKHGFDLKASNTIFVQCLLLGQGLLLQEMSCPKEASTPKSVILRGP